MHQHTKSSTDGGAVISMSHFPGVREKKVGSPSLVIVEYFDVNEPAVWVVGKSASPENNPFFWPEKKRKIIYPLVFLGWYWYRIMTILQRTYIAVFMKYTEKDHIKYIFFPTYNSLLRLILMSNNDNLAENVHRCIHEVHTCRVNQHFCCCCCQLI